MVLHFLPGFASRSLIGTVTNRTQFTNKSGKFLVDLGADIPPVALTKVSRPSDDEQLCVVDGKDLLRVAQQLIDSDISDDEVPSQPASIDPQIVEQAMRGWQPHWARMRHDRSHSATEVVLCAGVTSTHFFMSQTLEYNPEQLFADHSRAEGSADHQQLSVISAIREDSDGVSDYNHQSRDVDLSCD